MRHSLLPGKRVIVVGPKRAVDARCIGCKDPVTPGMCYTGSVLHGWQFVTIKGQDVNPIQIIREAQGEFTMTGGEVIDTEKRVGFLSRRKGFLCDKCAGNIATVPIRHRDGSISREMVVMTDPRPGFIGSLLLPQVETIRASEDAPSGPPSKRVIRKHGGL